VYSRATRLTLVSYRNEETLDSLLVGGEAKLELLLLVELSTAPSLVLRFSSPRAAASIAAHPDWLVTASQEDPRHRIRISNIRTGSSGHVR
jgi:hypothetical protein